MFWMVYEKVYIYLEAGFGIFYVLFYEVVLIRVCYGFSMVYIWCDIGGF